MDEEEVEEEDEAVDAAGVAVDVEDMTWDPHHQVRVSMIRARCIIFLKLFYYLSSLSDLFFCCCYISLSMYHCCSGSIGYLSPCV